MVHFDKWLTDVEPHAAADEVAREALSMRLAAVAHYLKDVIGGDDEREAVHQLRIWSRRASAALRLFTTAIPKSHQERMEKTLRKLRRTAGAVRDCDVYLARLESSKFKPPQAILKQLRRERRAARKKLQVHRRRLLRRGRFQRRVDKLLDKIAWPKRHSSREAPPFRFWYRQRLDPLHAAFWELADSNLNQDQRLHRFRLAAKRLRYALELAGPSLPIRGHRQIYEELSALQDRLGNVCDGLAAVDRTTKWLEDSPKTKSHRKLSELLQHEEASLAACRRQFLRWWSPARRTRWKAKWTATLRHAGASR